MSVAVKYAEETLKPLRRWSRLDIWLGGVALFVLVFWYALLFTGGPWTLPAIPVLEGAVRRWDHKEWRKQGLVGVEALCLIGKEGLEAAHPPLRDKNPFVRRAAMHGILVYGGDESLGVLEAAALDEDAHIKIPAKAELLRRRRGQPKRSTPLYAPGDFGPDI